MLNKLKRLFSVTNSSTVAPDRRERTVAGESLDQELDAIRQTMVIDPSRLSGASDAEDFEPAPSTARSQPAGRGPASKRAAVEHRTPLFRPVLRPPMAYLAALDDGSVKESEIFRLRGGCVVIGREQGDITFPHEVLMSSKHAQLECRRHRGGFQWHFVDLDSRNGSFFRVQQAYLRGDQEFLVGCHRFAFRIPNPTDTSTDPDQTAVPSGGSHSLPPQDARATQLVMDVKIALPKLVYRDAKGPEQTYRLDSTHIVIGSDAATSALSLNDPYVCPNHLQLQHTPRGWMISDLGSRNGVWLRLHDVKLDQITEFQLGEQRFYFRPPAARQT